MKNQKVIKKETWKFESWIFSNSKSLNYKYAFKDFNNSKNLKRLPYIEDI